jgi:protein-S-isoprenylcysteine O-methyltransferase Ste14
MVVSVLVLIIYFVLYAGLHSLLAALRVKQWVQRSLGAEADRWYRLAYNVIAVITLLPLLPLLALLPDRTFYVVPSPWRWLMGGGQLLALVGLTTTLFQTDLWRFLGLSQLLAQRPDAGEALQVGGFYCWVRHPLYFFSLLLIWLTPAMSVNLLTVYLLFTLYFYIGTFFEERRLLAEFGAVYEQYRRAVPRLIPRPGRCYRLQLEA